MATSFGATSGVGNRPLPPSMLTRPGANFSGHQTDATSGGAQGYGGFVDPNYYNLLSQYVQSLPGVAGARLAQQTQGNNSLDQMRQNIQSSVIDFGDPNVVQPLLAKYNLALDPQTAGLSSANSGGQGHWGNSVIAQLQQQAQAALQNRLQAIGGRGFESSGGSGAAINQSNIGLGHQMYDAGQALLKNLTGAINTNQDTQTRLTNDYQNALLKAPQEIAAHPNQYPLPQTPYSTVGGGQTPQFHYPTPSITPTTPGPGVYPTRTGAPIPPGPSLPPIPKATKVAAPTMGGIGHQT